MKTLRTLALMAAVIIGMLTSGYANAGNNRKGEVTELTSATFKTTVYDITKEGLDYLGKKPAIVDFTATWCGPCKRLSPILEELAKEYKGKIVIYKVDVDKCEDLARAFNISSIPALLFIPMEGQPEMIVGLRSKEAYKSDIETKLLKK
jgi:thioredoxin